MQPGFNRNQRERPLQKSMFLPNNDQFTIRTNPNQYQYQNILQMKRSTIPSQPQKAQSYPSVGNVGSQQIAYNPNPILNFNQTPRHKQASKLNQYSSFSQLNYSPQINIIELNQKIQRLTGIVDNHQDLLRKYVTNKDKIPTDTLIGDLQNRIRDIMPTFVNHANKDLYQHLFNYKLEINTLKDDVVNLADNCKIFFNNAQTDVSNSNKNNNSTLQSQQLICESNSPSSIEHKFAQVHKNFEARDNQLKQFLMSQIQKQIKSHSKPKPSNLISSLPSILIQYQQYFIIKPQQQIKPSSQTKIADQKSKKILINTNTYHIDKEGYLLDSNKRYLLDQKGYQIRLEESQIQLLRYHQVLQ